MTLILSLRTSVNVQIWNCCCRKAWLPCSARVWTPASQMRPTVLAPLMSFLVSGKSWYFIEKAQKGPLSFTGAKSSYYFVNLTITILFSDGSSIVEVHVPLQKQFDYLDFKLPSFGPYEEVLQRKEPVGDRWGGQSLTAFFKRVSR